MRKETQSRFNTIVLKMPLPLRVYAIYETAQKTMFHVF
jgi:hypothetical protein